MKNRNKFWGLLGCAAMLFAAACSDSPEYTPAGPVSGPQVYFSNESATTLTVEASASSVALDVLRADTNGSIGVPVTLTTTDPAAASLFRGDSEVVFGDGQNKAVYTISFDRDALEDGTNYEMTVTIDDPTLTTPYGASALTLTLKVPEPLVLLGTAIFTDDIVGPLFGADPVTYEVEVYENSNRPGFLLLKNAYTSEFPYNDPGDYVEEDVYFTIDVTNPDNVVIPEQGLGVDWGYGEMYIYDAGGSYNQGGVYKNGVITFPAKNIIVADDDGAYYANNNGAFRVVMPGAILTDYSVEIAYAGRFTDASNKNYAEAQVTGGEDVEYIEVALGAGSDPDAVLAAVEAGELETVRVSGNSGTARLPLAEDGTYTLVAVSYGGGEAREVAYTTFKFYAGTAPELSPLEKEYDNTSFIADITKKELFKTWIMWAVDPDDEDGITDRQPFAYVTFSENDEADFVDDDGYDYDMINIEGFGLGITKDDAHLWEYYDGVILNFYMHENLGQWSGYYVNYVPYVGGLGSYGAFYDEIMVGGLVDEGYMALAFSGWYNLGGNPDPNGFQWNAYTDEECSDSAGYLVRLYNIMFEDPAVSSLSTRAASLKAPKGSFSKKELNTLAQSLSVRENYVETARGMAHRKIDEMRAKRASKPAASQGSFEILSSSKKGAAAGRTLRTEARAKIAAVAF